MKDHWENLLDQIQTIVDDGATVINGLRSGPDVTKIKKKFDRNVKSLSKLIEEFSVFVPDPESAEIELPFDSIAFTDSWNDYKQFLYDVFGIVLVPVEERRRLNKLFSISRKNEENALELIDFYICCRYKSIFLPKDFQSNIDQPGDEPSKEISFTLKKKTI